MFARQQATGAIERQSVAIARRFAMDADLAAGRYRMNAVFGYIAEIPVAVSMLNRSSSTKVNPAASLSTGHACNVVFCIAVIPPVYETVPKRIFAIGLHMG